MQMQLDRFEQLLLAVVQIENELTVRDIDLVRGQSNRLLLNLEVSVTVAIEFHFFAHLDVYQVQVDRTLLLARLAQFGTFNCLAPVVTLATVVGHLLRVGRYLCGCKKQRRKN